MRWFFAAIEVGTPVHVFEARRAREITLVRSATFTTNTVIAAMIRDTILASIHV
jgi:hypothetical protein